MRAIRVTLAALAVLAVAMVGLVKVRLLSPPAHAQAGPLNVVVIMVDDLDVKSLEKAVDSGFMPNFQAFIFNKGKIFSNAFVSYSLCCPSRATFLTGQYAHNHGVKNNNGPDGGCAAQGFSDDSTVATWLQGVDYHTGFVGKYLNGYASNPSYPEDHCFDPLYVPEGWDQWQAVVGPSSAPGNLQEMIGYRINNNRVLEGPFDTNEYQTTKLAQKAALFIADAPPEDPFFLWVTPAAPHIESSQVLCDTNFSGIDETARTIRTPAPWDDDADGFTLSDDDPFNEFDVSDKPEPIKSFVPFMSPEHVTCTQDVWQDRLESLILVDHLIGTIGTALLDKEVVDTTVVVFTSDNGYYHGEHRLQKKVFPYEDGIRVPLVIRYPPFVKQIFTEFVVNTDLAPTIAALAGVSPPPGYFMDGRSLLQMLQGVDPTTWRKRFLIEHWRAASTFPIPTFFGIRTAPTDTTLLTPNALYMEYGDPTPTEFEYYDHLDQENFKNQMENAYDQGVDPDFDDQLLLLKTCSGTGPNSCQTRENE